MLRIANFTDSCTARSKYTAHFRRWHTKQSVVAFLAHELNACTCRTSNCSTLTWLKFHCMNECTNRNRGKWHCIAWLDVGTSTANYGVAYLQALWMKDVALFAVCIVQKSDTC